MSTRGFENITEADAARMGRKRESVSLAVTATIDPKAAKVHKYRAEPCIVTADLTLFTRKDIERSEVFQPLTFPLPKLKASLKMRATRLGIVGEWFGSTKEAKRWIALKQMELAGAITGLQRQPEFQLLMESRLSSEETDCGKYLADFMYTDVAAKRRVIEDCKGMRTPVYRLKKKIVEALYDITITET
jgi:hypothetical protein